MIEVWKPVAGWEALYEVSNLGRVRSLNRVVRMKGRWGGTITRLHPGRILKLETVAKASDFPKGYFGVQLAKDGGRVHAMVHVLVLKAFVGPKPIGQQARHMDGDSLNNRDSNLAWGTPKQNANDKMRHGTHPSQVAARV